MREGQRMSKTLELKKVIKSKLDTISNSGATYYELADNDCLYPYKVFSFDNIDLGDSNRDDIILVVDIWTKDIKEADRITDDIEELFRMLNNPTNAILPTFYCYSRQSIQDEDKTIKRRQLKIQVQNYER